VTSIYADAHVHIHGCFDSDRLFASARERALELGGPLLLLLSESDGDDYFERFLRDADRDAGVLASAGRGTAIESDSEARSESDSDNARRTAIETRSTHDSALSARIRRTAEPHSLIVDRVGEPGAKVYLVAGRQKVSVERIEVLALGLAPGDPLRSEPDGAISAERLVRRTLDAGAIAVLPWGFGKWIGPRGRTVAELAHGSGFCGHPRFFLGDIAHRCWPWPMPRAFRAGSRVLPGTDPLPLPGLEAGIARYGFCVEGGWDPERPVASLLDALSSEQRIESVGRRDSPWATLAQQLRYRIRRA